MRILGAVNDCRQALAAFFREAMARGWPVLVAEHERPKRAGREGASE